MKIEFHNTLTHRREPFVPIAPGRVLMYNCGPTVYDYAHIGNFRTFLFADVLRRFLELAGHSVQQVMNITDVGHMTDDSLADGGGEDKMALAARRIKEAKKSGSLPPGAVDNPDDPYQVAEFYTRAFIDDAKKLKLKIAEEYPAHMPRATQHVEGMKKIIAGLIQREHAYVAPDGAVYFDVQSFPDYGKLSGNTLDKLRTGAGGRIDDGHQSNKKHPADFLLWKPDPTHLMKWNSPWGEGYPGWHIECSAMSMTLLGKLAHINGGAPVIDIHTGGEDNIFPHHECEIAQSRCFTGENTFARYWLHARFLMVDGQKMSKSKGTFYTVRDVLEGKVTGRPVDPAVLRFELIKAHYRSNLNFTAQGLQDSAIAVKRLREAHAALSNTPQSPATPVAGASFSEHPAVAAFIAALADDLNIAAALAEVFKWLPTASADPSASAVLAAFNTVLAVLGESPSAQAVSDQDEGSQKAAAIDTARRARDFATADRLRKELIESGYEVMTTKAGTTARRRLA